MSDIKTTLRELSVIYGIHAALSGGRDVPSEKEFIEVLSRYLSPLQKQQISKFVFDFHDHAQTTILKNGVVLGKAIVNTFNLSAPVNLRWIGHQTQDEMPIDLIVNNLLFSLKEESFILENMGLYKLVNLLTGSNFKRGELHIFKKFAKDKYEAWFKTTWELFRDFAKGKKDGTIWKHEGRSYSSKIIKKGGKVTLHYQNGGGGCSKEYPLEPSPTIAEYNKGSTSVLREKVFAKWVNQEIANTDEYIAAKKDCAVTAGNALEKYVKDNFKKEGLARLLQIYDKEYYYAKVVNESSEIYQVPKLDDFEDVYELEDVHHTVPVSQLNFHTTIRNVKTGTQLKFRNEIRFSHGQFNGTPEAKLYYARGGRLDIIYNPPTTLLKR